MSSWFSLDLGMWIKWVGDGAFRADVEDVEGGEGGSGGKWRDTWVGNPVPDNTNR